MCTVETRDAPAPLTRPLAWMGLRKSAMDLAVEPPLSPMAPVDLDDDGAVTDVLNLALEIGGILLSSGEGAADTVAQAESVAAAFGLPGATVEVTFTSLTIGVNRRRGRPLPDPCESLEQGRLLRRCEGHVGEDGADVSGADSLTGVFTD